uniref:C-type lectin domain-containing protein n=1 Tax=Heligmosomoides polygyrus TaxID=6339 RepID=A0A183GFK4_HELPZ
LDTFKNACPDGWLRFKDSCYSKQRQKMDYDTAEQNCYAQGATLFVANSPEEWNVVMKSSTANSWTWVGLVQRQGMPTAKWQAPGAMDVSRLNWLLRPYRSGSNGWSAYSECAANFNTLPSTSSYLYFYPCTLQFASICERNSSFH